MRAIVEHPYFDEVNELRAAAAYAQNYHQDPIRVMVDCYDWPDNPASRRYLLPIFNTIVSCT